MSSSSSLLSDTSSGDPIVCDPSSKKIKYILITNGDSYVGRTLAIFIADQLTRREGQLKKKHWRVRVLCENKQTLKDLEKRGIDIKEVDYESQAMIRKHMKDHIKTVIFNPFTKSDRFVSHGKNLIDSAVHEKIKHIMMVSFVGCPFMKDKDAPVGQFNILEEHLRHSYKYGHWVVFRIPLIQQFMYFWSSMIENKSVIGMPLSRTDILDTVNIGDVCECLCQAALSKKSMVWNQFQVSRKDASHSSDGSSSNEAIEENEHEAARSGNIKRVYELKSSQPLSLEMIALSLTKALQEEGFDSDVEPAVITDEQLESYLKFISEEEEPLSKVEALLNTILPGVETSPASKIRSSSSGGLFYNFRSIFIGGGSDASGPSHDQDDPNWYPCPSQVLTPFGIQVVIDHFRVARCPDIPIVPNNDIRNITGREPVHLSKFFMNNRRQFRPEFK